MEHAARGASALASKDFSSAISHYTSAIATSPNAVDYYVKRSTAYTRASPADYDSSLADAAVAIVLAQKRGKRELIAQAHLRRGIALFGLGQWANSGQCFVWARKFNDKESSLPIWEKKVEGKLMSLTKEDKSAVITIQEVPDIDISKLGETARNIAIEQAEQNGKTRSEFHTENRAVTEPGPEMISNGTHTANNRIGSDKSNGLSKAPEISKPSLGVQTPSSKIRHEWYQTSETVVITIFAKGVPKDKAITDIQPASVALSFPLSSGSEFEISFDPLFALVDTAASTFQIMSTKVEILLKKAYAGQKWSALEGDVPLDEKGIHSGKSASSEAVRRTVLGATADAKGPLYPTSSRSGPKNWDQVASDLSRKPKAKDKGKDEKEESEGKERETGKDEYESDGEGGDPVHGFFRKLYAGADPDTQKAMMKSYTESSGTSLSTNWDEVSKGKVPVVPSSDMEEKKWNE